MSIFAEETDIWPFRRQYVFAFTQWKLDVRCNGDAVDHQPVEFDAHLPGHGVRIPVLMLHRPYQLTNQTDSVQPAIENSFTQRLRSDPKQHIWVNPHPYYQELQTVGLYWAYSAQTAQQRARRVPPRRIENFGTVANLDVVYPVFKPGCNDPELVYGVCFCRQIPGNVYTRTYMRFVHEDNNSRKAFDITQDFFSENANPNDPLMRHYSNPTLFRNIRDLDQQNTFAFYVCRGARLMVLDGRSPSPLADGTGHIRSLYQAGSIVVCTGTRGISMGCTGYDGKLLSAGWNALFNKKKERNQILQPRRRSNRAFDDWEVARDADQPGARPRMNELRDQVIFLGAIESEFNSACWRLIIDDGYDQDYCQTWLSMPNQGVIEDIAPWNSGFELIRARQRYEQPWRAGLLYQPNTPVPEFQVPDEYVIRRILGVGEWGPIQILYQYHYFDVQPPPVFPDRDRSIHRYVADQHAVEHLSLLRHFEQLTQWHQSPWRNLTSPPAPPLLPPVEWNHGYKYLDRFAKVNFFGKVGNEHAFVVGDLPGKYRLKYLDNTPGYCWFVWTEDHENRVINETQGNPNFEMKQWIRWGVDHMKYIKVSWNTNYKTKMLVLQQI